MIATQHADRSITYFSGVLWTAPRKDAHLFDNLGFALTFARRSRRRVVVAPSGYTAPEIRRAFRQDR